MAINARVLSRIPSDLRGEGGLSVDRTDGVYTVFPDWTDLNLSTDLGGNQSKEVWTRDPATNVYERVALSTLTSAVGGFSADLTPAQITADQNNYAPAGIATASTVRLSTDAKRTITGMAASSSGRFRILQNVGTFDITLSDQSASSTAANRFELPNGDYILSPDQSLWFRYDSVIQRWRPISSTGAVVPIYNPWGVVYRKLRDGNAINVKMFGDSLFYGYTPPGPPYQSNFNPPTALAQALQWLKYGSATVTNCGITGATAASGYAQWSGTTGGDIWVMMYGQNDANTGVTVRAFYEQMVLWVQLALLRGAAPLLVSAPRNKAAANDFNERPYAAAMAEVAIRFGIPHLDAEEQIGWNPNRWNADGVHLTDTAYNELGYHIGALISQYDGTNIRRIGPGQTLYATDNFAAGITLFAHGSAVTGQLAQIAINSDYLMVSGYFTDDVYPVLTLFNSNAGTARQVNVYYGGGNSNVPNFNCTNPGGDGVNTPYRTHHQLMRIPKGYRSFLILNPDTTGGAVYVESIQFIAAGDAVSNTFGDANITLTSGDRRIYLGQALTTTRTWTLPPRAAVAAGTQITFYDRAAGISGANNLRFQRQGSDTLNGGTGFFTLTNARASITFIATDDALGWVTSQIDLGAGVTGVLGLAQGGTSASTAAAARTALGVTATGADTTYASRANNLSDLASASAARTSLGLAAVAASGSASDLGTGTLPSARLSGDYPSLNIRQIVGGGSGGTGVPANTTVYLCSGYQQFSGAAFAGVIMPFSGTAKRLFVQSNNPPVGAQTYTATVQKNGVDTALTCQMTGSAVTANDTSHSFTFAAGDYLCLKIVTSATAAANSVFMFGFEVDNP